MVRGGPGNDLVYGGASRTYRGGQGFAKYMYGDEGDDQIWGSNRNDNEYMFGGEGNDVLYGGFLNDNEYITGNDGDDIIYPASEILVTDRVRGGKGDDLINPVELEYDDAGTLITDLTSRENQSAYGDAETNWQGGEGNDTIWGKYMPGGDQTYEGGNGDDTIYGAYGQTNNGN